MKPNLAHWTFIFLEYFEWILFQNLQRVLNYFWEWMNCIFHFLRSKQQQQSCKSSNRSQTLTFEPGFHTGNCGTCPLVVALMFNRIIMIMMIYSLLPSQFCTSYTEGRLLLSPCVQLLCPKCGSKLGSFNWCGDQCSCGRWVTPAFQLHRNRVDEIRQLNMHR